MALLPMAMDETVIREYEVVFDLTTHRSTLIGIDDFYGRPLEKGQSRSVDVAEAIHPDDVPKMLDVIESLSQLDDGEILHYELRFQHADGTTILATYESTPLERNRDGNVRLVRSKVRWIK
jgi:PAS domain-containing protein